MAIYWFCTLFTMQDNFAERFQSHQICHFQDCTVLGQLLFSEFIHFEEILLKKKKSCVCKEGR